MPEDKLQRLIVDAFEDVKSEISSALGELERVSAEAAKLLHPLVSELAAARLVNRGPVPDTVAMLADAVNRLQHLPDSAQVLASATLRLSGPAEFGMI